MRKIILALIFLLPLTTALQITEIELNPLGTDSQNEWIEFYSVNKTDLSEYTIINHDGSELILAGIFQGYFIYTISKQWLDNQNESIQLYKSSQLIQETPILKDSKNDEQTWQLCDNEWVFKENTKEKQNTEPEKIESNQTESEKTETSAIVQENKTEIEENPEMTKENQTIETDDETETTKITPNLQTNVKSTQKEIIYLNPKTIKTENSTETIKEKNYGKYSLIIFCVLLCFLYIAKKPKKKKNEWQ